VAPSCVTAHPEQTNPPKHPPTTDRLLDEQYDMTSGSSSSFWGEILSAPRDLL